MCQIQSKKLLIFDEIQQVQGWEKAINSISIEYNADIYITGSNAYLLSLELSTLISGKYVEIKILSLSFKEYFEYYNDRNISREEIYNNYFKYGELPQLLILPNKKTIYDFLSSIYDIVILKDVLSRNKIRDIDLIKRVFAFICGNIGNIISTNKIANYIAKEAKLDSSIRPATVGNILEMLENAFIIFKVSRYDVKGKEILKSLEKYYVADSGLKNFVVDYGLENYGYTIENVIYLELIRRGYKVYVGKNEAKEIDFVAKKGDITVYYKVTETLLSQSTQKREVSSFSGTNDFHEKIIITTDKTYTTNLKGIKIINIIDFLLS